ncbi:hypothetical protein ACFE04_020224 [Oxalis oulophora]
MASFLFAFVLAFELIITTKAIASGTSNNAYCGPINASDADRTLFALNFEAIIQTYRGFPRPLIDLRRKTFAKTFDQAMGHKLNPPFNIYEDSTKFLLAMYLFPFVGASGYTGTIPYLKTFQAKDCGIKDEGLIVPKSLGAENRTTSNILIADGNSLAYARTSQEMLRETYGTGNESIPGGYFPAGANGRIAQGFRNNNQLN